MLSYGGSFFTLTVPSTSYAGMLANDTAANTIAVLSHGSFMMHAVNVGQRHLQLNSTCDVNSDSS